MVVMGSACLPSSDGREATELDGDEVGTDLALELDCALIVGCGTGSLKSTRIIRDIKLGPVSVWEGVRPKRNRQLSTDIAFLILIERCSRSHPDTSACER